MHVSVLLGPLPHFMVRIQCLGLWAGLWPTPFDVSTVLGREGKGSRCWRRFDLEWILSHGLSHGSIEPWFLFFSLHCLGQFARAAHSPVGWAVIFAAMS